jgi:hypothetical protein
MAEALSFLRGEEDSSLNGIVQKSWNESPVALRRRLDRRQLTVIAKRKQVKIDQFIQT